MLSGREDLRIILYRQPQSGVTDTPLIKNRGNRSWAILSVFFLLFFYISLTFVIELILSPYRNLKRIFTAMGVPNLRFHDLRHSYAVLSLQSGCDIKTVQENLGHYAAAFTLDTYGHVTEQMRRDGVDKINRYVEGMEEKMG